MMASELQPPSPEALAALLDWYVANDVDVAIEEEAVNRLVARAAEEMAPEPAQRPMPPAFDAAPRAQPSQPIATALTPEAEVLAAREAAASAPTLEALRDALPASKAAR